VEGAAESTPPVRTDDDEIALLIFRRLDDALRRMLILDVAAHALHPWLVGGPSSPGRE